MATTGKAALFIAPLIIFGFWLADAIEQYPSWNCIYPIQVFTIILPVLQIVLMGVFVLDEMTRSCRICYIDYIILALLIVIMSFEFGSTISIDVIIILQLMSSDACMPGVYKIMLPIIVFLLNIFLFKFTPLLVKNTKRFIEKKKFDRFLREFDNIYLNIYTPGFDIDSIKPILTLNFLTVELQPNEIAILKEKCLKPYEANHLSKSNITSDPCSTGNNTSDYLCSIC